MQEIYFVTKPASVKWTQQDKNPFKLVPKLWFLAHIIAWFQMDLHRYHAILYNGLIFFFTWSCKGKAVGTENVHDTVCFGVFLSLTWQN